MLFRSESFSGGAEEGIAGAGAGTGVGTEAVEAIREIAGTREDELETESTAEESGELDKVPEEESQGYQELFCLQESPGCSEKKLGQGI